MEKFKDILPIENIREIRRTSGGDVNEAFEIYTDVDRYFMLVQKGRDERFYAGEIEGLRLFEEIGITAPRVIASGEVDNDAYLVISYLDEGSRGSQAELAEMVAKLHKYENPNGKFGFNHPHGGRDTSFSNAWSETWAEMILDQRLDGLRDQLFEMGLWDENDISRYEKARKVIVAELNNHESSPSLLHGDLWGGNYMFLSDGRPALFDPSPLYGDREFDIGITTVFGGFSEEFYEKYNELYPLEPGYELRLEFYRLYLYMVHLVKFGRTYESSVNRTLDMIINY